MLRWALFASHVLDDKKGLDTVVLDVGDTIGITDIFVISSGTNRRQVQMLADEVESQIKAAGGPSPISVEGLTDANWVLLDYGSFVVHVFSTETRKFYELERLWADVGRVDWQTAPREHVSDTAVPVDSDDGEKTA